MFVKDLFWWIFLNTWQPNADDQRKLFYRIVDNFIHLLSSVKHLHYQETFLKVIMAEIYNINPLTPTVVIWVQL